VNPRRYDYSNKQTFQLNVLEVILHALINQPNTVVALTDLLDDLDGSIVGLESRKGNDPSFSLLVIN
jgi:hypothetical protein